MFPAVNKFGSQHFHGGLPRKAPKSRIMRLDTALDGNQHIVGNEDNAQLTYLARKLNDYDTPHLQLESIYDITYSHENMAHVRPVTLSCNVVE